MRINRKNLEMAMARKAWSQKDLAAAMGMSVPGLYLILKHGGDKTRPVTVGKIAKALGVPVEEIGI